MVVADAEIAGELIQAVERRELADAYRCIYEDLFIDRNPYACTQSSRATGGGGTVVVLYTAPSTGGRSYGQFRDGLEILKAQNDTVSGLTLWADIKGTQTKGRRAVPRFCREQPHSCASTA